MTIFGINTESSNMVNTLTDLKLYLLTWNVVGRPPIEDLREALGLAEPVDISHIPDFYGLALQEVSCKPQDLLAEMIIEDPWVVAFRDILQKWGYVKLKQIRLQGMSLYLFSKREHITYIRGLQTSYTRTGLGGMWGNKGGVTIRFNAYGCSVCIVNCHLAAHDSELQQRIDDYNSILDHQKFVDPQTENIITHDYTFWFGDLNFRLDEFTAEEIVHLVEKKNYPQLLLKDQLRKVIKLGQAFSEFTESPPMFPPTYKYNIGRSEYDISKRKPAWTDRVLFRFTPNAYENVTLSLKQLHYGCHEKYEQSDHKPVTSSFLLKVFSHPKEKRVFFLPIKDWRVNSDSAAWYTFSEGAEPSTWDWIGLFRADYTSTDEHVCYIWAPVRPSSSTPVLPADSCIPEEQNDSQASSCPATSLRQHQGPWYRVVFADQTLLIPGRYRLFYISSEFDDILGVSEPFEYIPSHGDVAIGGGLFSDVPLLASLAVVIFAMIMLLLRC
ncbi:inositol polyphosphate 5-phosphatase K-like isoform X1 [Argiope bruennichi]|uniref:Inositol polyphosphate 5-phosphatase K like protein n=1 Tax=Argiope bruennichi TaxID=94029 RepID=A0A8T0FQ81_ARGBR|nr:inositol polyphosphate 5-phosphatase K-like isoform X1 [Argiope bruennichi]XP_055938851.1 inositol polyphosphate 5-phosphatase K-like isoform X1 [Argiope bruennichi]KAF8793347.1 Inositol polyphosphate 5-phosphatase K like protein [Argiope bruennichi]